MSWRDTFRTAAEAVRTHRLRSALTMLGILIGITAVILTVGLGNGAKAEVRDQINELGTNLLVDLARAAAPNSTGVRGGFGSASTLTVGDAEALAPATPPPTSRPSLATVDHAGLADLRRHELDDDAHRHDAVVARRSAPATVIDGRFLTEARPAATRPRSSCSDPTPRPSCSASADPVGQHVTYNGTTLQVVGVLAELSSSDDDQQQRRGHRAALDLRRAPRRRQQPQRGRRRST